METHVKHAEGFAACIRGQPRRVVDLGSGGGVPGLVLAALWPQTQLVLLDSNRRRVDFLQRAVRRADLGSRVTTVLARAEEAGRDPGQRGASDVVVARSFGPPPVVAECAAPLLEVGGRLVVSEPPQGEAERWPQAGVAQLGLCPEKLEVHSAGRFQVLRQVRACPSRFPRRPGVPGKRPVF